MIFFYCLLGSEGLFNVFLNEVLLQLHEEKYYWLLYCLDINKCAEKETKQ